MASPESNGPFEPNDDDLETRGAIWQFLRYAVDRKNGVDKTYWSALTHSPTVGEQNLSAALGVNLAQWLGDFAVAQYTDDAVSGVDSRFTQPSWSFRTILPKLKAQQTDPDVFPLLTRTLGHNSTISLNLSDKGGTGYLRAGVAANGVGSIKLTTSSGPIPAGVRVTVIRTK
jgi:hypothetical protein